MALLLVVSKLPLHHPTTILHLCSGRNRRHNRNLDQMQAHRFRIGYTRYPFHHLPEESRIGVGFVRWIVRLRPSRRSRRNQPKGNLQSNWPLGLKFASNGIAMPTPSTHVDRTDSRQSTPRLREGLVVSMWPFSWLCRITLQVLQPVKLQMELYKANIWLGSEDYPDRKTS